MRKKKIIVAISVLIALMLSFIIFIHQGKEDTIKIGAILSITGPGNHIGKQVRNGMLLAIDEVNKWGGVNGRMIELIIEDSKSDPVQAKKAFGKIEDSSRPLLYISTLSSVANAVNALAEKDKVVLMSLVATSPDITIDKEWTFRYYPTAEVEVPPILSILKDLKVKNLGIHYLDDAFGRSVFRMLKKEFEKTGGTTVDVSFNTFLKKKHKGHIPQLKNTDAIFVVGFPEHFEVIFKLLGDAGYPGPILASSDAAVPFIFETPEANGVYLAAPIIYNKNFVLANETRKNYETKYGLTFDHMAANGYDLIKIIAGLLDEEELSRASLKDLLEQGFSSPGILGLVNAEPGEHDIGFLLRPAQVKDGKIKYKR